MMSSMLVVALLTVAEAMVESEVAMLETPTVLGRRERPDLPEQVVAIIEEETEIPPEIASFVSRSVLMKVQRWRPGSSLNVCFRGGSEEVVERIVAVASAWNRHANIELDFGPNGARRRCRRNDGADIRVGFSAGGYWSVVGRQSRIVADRNLVTLNLEGFHMFPPKGDEFRNVVLHEFGHALGFEHEHQHPDASCADELDWQKMYRYYAGYPNYWTVDEVNFNILPVLRSQVEAGAYDAESVMHYVFDRSLFRDAPSAKCFIDLNVALSAGDIAGLKAAYPPNDVAAAEVSDAVAQLQRDVSAAVRQKHVDREEFRPLLQELRSDLVKVRAK